MGATTLSALTDRRCFLVVCFCALGAGILPGFGQIPTAIPAVLNVGPNTPPPYQADTYLTTITGQSIVYTGNPAVAYQAGTQINLNPGFQATAQPGSGIAFMASIAPPDFQIWLTTASPVASPNSSTTYTVNVAGIFNFAGNVGLSLTGLPSTMTATFTPTPPIAVPLNNTATGTLTLGIGTTAQNTYPFTVTGTSGNTSHGAVAAISVAPQADRLPPVTPVQSSREYIWLGGRIVAIEHH